MHCVPSCASHNTSSRLTLLAADDCVSPALTYASGINMHMHIDGALNTAYPNDEGEHCQPALTNQFGNDIF